MRVISTNFGTLAAYPFKSCPGCNSSSASSVTPQEEGTEGTDPVNDEFCLSFLMECSGIPIKKTLLWFCEAD